MSIESLPKYHEEKEYEWISDNEAVDKSFHIIPEEDEWEEKIYEAVDLYQETKESNEKIAELRNEWMKDYFECPVSFFEKENREKLKEMPMDKRLNFLARSCASLRVTPGILREYYKDFPEDLRAVNIIFKNNHGYPDDFFDNNLASVSALEMIKSEPDLGRRYNLMQKYLEIAERREKVPSFILDGTEEMFAINFKDFGEAAKGLSEAYDEANELSFNGSYFINPDKIFSEEYKKLDAENKALFLRKSIDTLHLGWLFEEAFNTGFTAQSAAERKKNTMERIGESSVSMDPAHSVLFKTYQPFSSYDVAQEYFDYEMNSTCIGGGFVEEYPYHRLLLAVLKELGKTEAQQEENVDKIVDFWDKNRNPIFANAVAEILSKQGPERAASGLLKRLRAEEEDKNALTAMLYRLEFGKIGISKEGVKYLERIYDLKELNNPDYHVSRLTPDGDMGVFDEHKKSMKYFNLGNLDSDEKVVEAVTMDFVYETLFFPQENETPEERQQREKYLEEFKSNYYDIASKEFFKNSEMKLNNLSFREQGWFLIYYNEADEEKKKRLEDFVERFGEEGVRAFLSLEEGYSIGETILHIAETAAPEESIAILYKFGEIISNVKKSRQEIEILFAGNKEVSERETEKVRRGLLKKGGKLLMEYSDRVDKLNISKEKTADRYEDKILHDLGSYNADLILTASVFKAMDRGSVKLEDLQGVSLESVTGDKFLSGEIRGVISSIVSDDNNEISSEKIIELAHDFAGEKDRETIEAVSRMVEMYEKNYESRPRFKETLIRDFLKVLAENGDKTLFYFLKKDGNINAFCRFDELPNGKKYAGSLNVDPTIHDFSIGSCFFLECFNKESKNSDIVAACDAFAPMSSVHIEKEGFVVKEIISDYNQEDEKERRVTAFSIEKERGKNYHYSGKNKEELVKEYANIQDEAKYFSGDCFVMKFPADSMDREAVSEKLINDEKYIMTRFFYYGSNNEEIYCAFEKGGN